MKQTANQHQQELLVYLYQQLEYGFKPSYLITYHYRAPHETQWQNRHPGRTSVSSKGRIQRPSLWQTVNTGSDRYYQQRRNNASPCSKDNQHLRSLIVRRHFGVQRLDAANIPMLFFQERGHGEQLHGHLLITQPTQAFDSVQLLTADWHGYLTNHAKCLSRQKKPHVQPITCARGIMRYLVKETDQTHLSLDVEASKLVVHSSCCSIAL